MKGNDLDSEVLANFQNKAFKIFASEAVLL